MARARAVLETIVQGILGCSAIFLQVKSVLYHLHTLPVYAYFVETEVITLYINFVNFKYN